MSGGSGVQEPAIQTATILPGNGSINGVYLVLQGLTEDYLLGGYGYLQWSSAGNAWHEAVDLNSMGGGDADWGASVVAPLDGVVTFVERWDGCSTGFGTHVALWIGDPRAAPACYLHVAHLDTCAVLVGQPVVAGQLVGTCGKSGNQMYAHCHTAMWRDVPPGGWNFWPTGYSQAWVAEHTLDPAAWFWDSVDKATALALDPNSPEEGGMAILSDAQATAIQAQLWQPYAFNPDTAIATAWRAEWLRGVWRGRAISPEQAIPQDDAAGKPAGAWQLFEYGAACWLPGEEPSWTG